MEKYQKNLKISVVGNAASGKTNVALLIKDTLAQYGIDVEIHDEFEDLPVNVLREKRDKAMELLAKSYEGRKIVLDIHQGYKRFGAHEKPFYASDINRVAKEYNYVAPTESEILEYVKAERIHIEPEWEWEDSLDLVRDYGVKIKDMHNSPFITIQKGDTVVVWKSRYDNETTDWICKQLGYNKWTFKS